MFRPRESWLFVLALIMLFVMDLRINRQLVATTAQIGALNEQFGALQRQAVRLSGLTRDQHETVEAQLTALSQTLDRVRGVAAHLAPRPESTAWLTNRDRELTARLRSLEQWRYRSQP